MTNSQAFIASISQDAHGLCHGQGQIRQSITCVCVCEHIHVSIDVCDTVAWLSGGLGLIM